VTGQFLNSTSALSRLLFSAPQLLAGWLAEAVNQFNSDLICRWKHTIHRRRENAWNVSSDVAALGETQAKPEASITPKSFEQVSLKLKRWKLEGGEWERVSPDQPSLGKRREIPQGVRDPGRSPSQKRIWCILGVTEHFRSLPALSIGRLYAIYQKCRISPTLSHLISEKTLPPIFSCIICSKVYTPLSRIDAGQRDTFQSTLRRTDK